MKWKRHYDLTRNLKIKVSLEVWYHAVGKQPFIPLTNLGRKLTLKSDDDGDDDNDDNYDDDDEDEDNNNDYNDDC